MRNLMPTKKYKTRRFTSDGHPHSLISYHVTYKLCSQTAQVLYVPDCDTEEANSVYVNKTCSHLRATHWIQCHHCKVWYHCIRPGVLYKELLILPSVSPVPNASEVPYESVHKSYPHNWMRSYLQMPATDNHTILQNIYIIWVKCNTYIHSTCSTCTNTNLQHIIHTYLQYIRAHSQILNYVRTYNLAD